MAYGVDQASPPRRAGGNREREGREEGRGRGDHVHHHDVHAVRKAEARQLLRVPWKARERLVPTERLFECSVFGRNKT